MSKQRDPVSSARQGSAASSGRQESTSSSARQSTADIQAEPPSVDDSRLTTWRAFLYAQSTVMPRLDSELRAACGITLAEFDALLQLAFAPRQRLRMSKLAERVLLSRSGVTRLVDRLERDGHARREPDAPDGRGAYAVLTRQGADRLQEAIPLHMAGIEAHFLDHLDADEMASLADALGRVAAANGRPLPSAQRSAEAMRRITK